MSVATITPQELAELCRDGRKIDLIDVRTPVEYREVHVPLARNVPLDRLDPTLLMQEHDVLHEPLYMICRSGKRGEQACEKFIKACYANVVNVEGGTLAWEACGLAVVRGERVISLERQVRIAAGLLVCLGILLGWLIHPGFLAVSAFVGAGLVFAGVTDTCGMGMLLARMPWNRGSQPGNTCGAG